VHDDRAEVGDDLAVALRAVLVDRRRRLTTLRRRVRWVEWTLGFALALLAAGAVRYLAVGSLTRPLTSPTTWAIAAPFAIVGWALGRGIVATLMAPRVLTARRAMSDASARLDAHRSTLRDPPPSGFG
jgi:hypothetical protein